MMLLVAPMALLAMAAPASLELQSDSTCPTADAIRARLPELLGTGMPGPAKVSVRSDGDGDRLIIEFTWPAATHPEVRHLTVSADCADRAESAAVVIAAALGTLPGAALAAPHLATTGAPTPIPAPPPSLTATATASARGADAAASPSPADPRRWWLGAGLLVPSAAPLAPGLRVELGRARATTTGIGWLASAQVTAPRDRALGSGTSHWMRPALAAAAQAHLRAGAALLGVDAGPVAGLTVAWGSGYPIDQSDQSLTWGLAAGARATWATGRLRPWLELRVTSWLRGQRLRSDVTSDGPAQATSLPSTEAAVALGCSFFR